MPQLDPAVFLPQIFWAAVIFGLLYLVMARIALPRIGMVLEDRRNRIDGDLDKAAQLREDAEAAIHAYEQLLDEARAKAQAKIAQAMEQATAEATRRQHALGEKLAEETAAAEARIAAARHAAMSEIRSVAVGIAQDVVQRLGGATPSDDDARRAVAQAAGGV
ncbi:MAG: F0F1 ATP synthase subunit B' [Alphaproteobacteria bacterium]